MGDLGFVTDETAAANMFAMRSSSYMPGPPMYPPGATHDVQASAHSGDEGRSATHATPPPHWLATQSSGMSIESLHARLSEVEQSVDDTSAVAVAGLREDVRNLGEELRERQHAESVLLYARCRQDCSVLAEANDASRECGSMREGDVIVIHERKGDWVRVPLVDDSTGSVLWGWLRAARKGVAAVGDYRAVPHAATAEDEDA